MHTPLRLIALRWWGRSIYAIRRSAWHIGFILRRVAKSLLEFGEKEIRDEWNIILLTRLPMAAEIEIMTGYPGHTPRFPCIYRGPISGARFELDPRTGKRFVVLRLNWVGLRRQLTLKLFLEPWQFSGTFEVRVDPERSALHKISDDALWFMFPSGGYGVLRFGGAERLRFAGTPETPRTYTYY